MIKLQKTKGKDFALLNLTDVQMGSGEWSPEHKNCAIINYTLEKLYEAVKPDLVTISGDLSWCGDTAAVEALAAKLDTFGVPYSAVWGNHDQDGGYEKLDTVIECLSKHPLFVYENGPEELGRGNFVIGVYEEEKFVHGVIMMDTHDRFPHETKANGYGGLAWAKLTDEQIEWYRSTTKELIEMGCANTSLITHIPIYAYHYAWQAAFKEGLNSREVTLEESYGNSCWNEGYESSFGVKYDDICCYPEDEGTFDAIKELGSTKYVICGHDHTSNYSVEYKGVRLSYGLKTGAGCYWNPKLNGGSVIKINENGAYDFYHEYVDISHLI